MNIRRSVERCCAARGRTKKELSEGTGISQSYLSIVMARNSCSLDILQSMAKFFCMHLDEFIRMGRADNDELPLKRCELTQDWIEAAEHGEARE